MTARIVTCDRCDRDRRHHARGLCSACYNHCRATDTLDDYRLVQDQSFDVDDINVDRAVDWLTRFYRSVPNQERRHSDRIAGRPNLTQGEKIAVLRRTRHDVPRWVAVQALGISGKYARRYLDAAATAA